MRHYEYSCYHIIEDLATAEDNYRKAKEEHERMVEELGDI